MGRTYRFVVSLIITLLGIINFGGMAVHAASPFSMSGSATYHHVTSTVNLVAGTSYEVKFNCTDMSSTGLSGSVEQISIFGGSDSFSFNGCGAGIKSTIKPTMTTSYSIDLHVHTNQSSCPPGGLCQWGYNVNIDDVSAPVVAVVVETKLPEPPPIAPCTDSNFDAAGMVRTHFTNDADRGVINCRVIASEGSYMNWFGGVITFPEMIGDKTVLDLGVIGAVDVYSPSGATGFMGDVDICLKGSGSMIYMNGNNAPRFPQLWSAWTTDAFPGYTCTTLYAPGTVILVERKP